MRIDNPSISGSLSFIGGNNSISATSVNLTGSFSGSVVGTFEGGFSSAATTEISGAFDSVSSSLSDRIADQESFSSSLDATFATDTDLNLVSSSVDSLNAATSSYALENSISGSFTSTSSSLASELLKNTTDTLTGDLTVTGTLTAQDLHVQEVTSSILFSSGSNILGNSSSDVQTIYGNVGIGTTEGKALLHLRSATPYIYLDDTSTTGTRTRFQLTVGDVGSTQTGTFSFNNTAGTSLLDVMTINENGNVGVGTTAAATKFHSYTSAAAPAIIAQGDSGNEQIVIKRYSNANEQLIFGFHSSDYGRIQAVEQGVGYRPLALNQDGGSVGIGNYTPVSQLEVRTDLNSTNFTGITVTNTNGGGTNLSRAGIAFKAYDWVQGAIWHGRNMGDGNQGALVLGTNPNTSDLTVGGVVGRMYIINDGNVGIGQPAPSAKFQVRIPGLGSTDGNSSTGVIFEGDRHDLMINQHRTGNTSDWNSTTVRLQNRVDTTLMSSIDFVADSSYQRHIDINTASNSFNTRFTHNGRVGIATTNPNATLHVNGGAHFGPDSGVLNPSTGEVLIETVQGGTPTLKMYPYNGSVFDVKSDGTTATIGWGSGADREVNILNTGAGSISVGIGTGAPSSVLHVFGNLSSTPATFEGNSSSNAWVRFKAGSTASTWQIGATSGAFQFYDELNTATRLVINSSGNVGIGTTSPGRKLTITGNVSGDANNLLLSNENDTDGDSASIGFSMLSNNSYVKSGIFFERTTTQGRGSLHLAVNNEVNGNNVTKSDAKLTINNSGNVGIGTTSPTAKLDINGSVRYRGEIYNQDSFIASGNYSSGTWYDATDTSQLTENGIYIISAYVDDYGAGGGTYFCWYASVPFNWVTTGTNRTTAVTFPTLLGTGHAAGTIPSFRITQELGTAGAKSRIQFNPNNNWSGMDNGSGKSFRVYFKRIGS